MWVVVRVHGGTSTEREEGKVAGPEARHLPSEVVWQFIRTAFGEVWGILVSSRRSACTTVARCVVLGREGSESDGEGDVSCDQQGK